MQDSKVLPTVFKTTVSHGEGVIEALEQKPEVFPRAQTERLPTKRSEEMVSETRQR